MLMSPDKSQCIKLRQKNKRKYPPLSLHLVDAKIPETNQVKYLGLIMDSQLNYRDHINYVYGKAARKLGYLTFLCSYKGIRPSLSVYNLLYKTIIRPNLEIQRIAMCRILGVMQITAYDTVNIIAQMPYLELRRQEEELKLFQRCKIFSDRFPNHNLSQAYQLWKRDHDVQPGKRFCWLGKLSSLSLARINISSAELEGFDITLKSGQTHICTSTHVSVTPHSTKSPFQRWSVPTPSQILASLDENCVVVFADASTMPNPGIGWVGLFIQDQSLSNWLEFEIPIQGITTSIGSEIQAIKIALEYVAKNYQ
ncbi:hypothetical protein RFI_01138 [Reticulomyxa filosa]|uniref:RNase H type-1 domain-containing protein n=1 Tax=Reticulomyxa filosa TaxID=46433 RepID=X6PCZ8_RETFI|nr:hypothetical protein RFI_01138 [Reticulomyxa filosa]|eukprot:ETO35924.1 hypothetical protein RFI_01138 [Reticulomyxa filosa]